MKHDTSLLVSLRMYDGASPPEKIKVTLHPKEGGQSTPLQYDPDTGYYVIEGQPPGEYELHVEASKLQKEERPVFLGMGRNKEVFYLGPPGLPFYFRGRVRIPFDALPGLVGIALTKHPSGAEETDLERYANGLGFSRVDVPAAVREDMARVFRGDDVVPASLSDLESHPLVRRAGPAIRFERDSLSFLTNELIVAFRPHVSSEESDALLEHFLLKKVRAFPYAQNTFLVYRDGPAELDLLQVTHQLLELHDDSVVYAEPNLVTTAVDAQQDFLFLDQLSMTLAGFDQAWNKLESIDQAKKYGDPGILIAILDKGVEATLDGVEDRGENYSADHPDFEGTLSNGQKKFIFFYDLNKMKPGNLNSTMHGSNVTGVATALADNDPLVEGKFEGIRGAAPNCRVLSLIRGSSMDDSEYADAYIWIAGFDPGWKAGEGDYDDEAILPDRLIEGADVINSSFARDVDPAPSILYSAFDYVTSVGRNGKGCVMVFAAGNARTLVSSQSPAAAAAKTIAVAASTIADKWAPYSNHGLDLDVCAPSGELVEDAKAGVVTTARTNQGNLIGSAGTTDKNYANDTGGTSLAAPMVSGLAALMLSVNPDLTWVQVRDIIRATAQKGLPNPDPPDSDMPPLPYPDADWNTFPPGYSRYYGYGRINAGDAVQEAEDSFGDYTTKADTWIRENSTDFGDVPSHPMYSDDIWVRNLPPFLDKPPFDHQSPVSGQTNWVHAIVRNRGVEPSSDVYARLLVTRWAGTEFIYPDDFEPVISPPPYPLNLSLFAPGSYLIGEEHLPVVPAGDIRGVVAKWSPSLMPPSQATINGVNYASAHSCLLADVTPHDGPPPTGNRTADNNNLCQRNLTIVDLSSQTLAPLLFVVGHKQNAARHLQLEVDRKKLSPRVRLYIDYVEEATTQAVKRALFRSPLTYTLDAVNWRGRTVFALPTVRRARAPILRESGQYQWVALGATGLDQLPAGKHWFDVIQRAPRGPRQGLLRIELVKP